MSDPLRVLFYGSPDFALPTLQALIDSPFRPIAVVTQPDARAGRGRSLRPPPIKELAAAHGIPALQPAKLRDRAAIAQITSLRPDMQVVAAYGQLIPSEILGLPTHGTLNVHASLLPRWRGAAPISAAILHGDTETGVSIMLIDETEDTGDILRQQSTPIQSIRTRRRPQRSPRNDGRATLAGDDPGLAERRHRSGRPGPGPGHASAPSQEAAGQDQLESIRRPDRPTHPRLHALAGRRDNPPTDAYPNQTGNLLRFENE